MKEGAWAAGPLDSSVVTSMLALFGTFGIGLMKAGVAHRKNVVYNLTLPLIQLCLGKFQAHRWNVMCLS